MSATKINIRITSVSLVLLLNALLQPSTAFAQVDTVDSANYELYKPKLILDFPILDLPYLQIAAQTSANRRLNQLAGSSGTANAGDYLRAFNNLSMRQATALTKSLHSTGYFLNNTLWNKWIAPTNGRRKLLNRVGANITSAATDLLLARAPFAIGWLHEEFHRNTMTRRGIASYNNFWEFQGVTDFYPNTYVSRVKDEDLIQFKVKYPAEIVRMNSAGIEAEYLLLQGLQKDNFFHGAKYPAIAAFILATDHATGYVRGASSESFDKYANEELQTEGPDISKRDFTGHDFAAWVYDLYKPHEPYEARGVHPSGSGIRRYIKSSDYTPEMLTYIKRMGSRQYLNFASPHLLGISRIKLSKDIAFNIALRHYLTSFGDDLGGDLFLKIKDKNILLTWHGYQNKDHFFPGVEAQLLDLPLKVSSKTLPLTLRTMLWLQPQDQQFYTDKGQAGGLIYAQLRSPKGKTWQPYLEVEGKTQGWVAGNPFLDANFTVRAGVSAYFNFKPKK